MALPKKAVFTNVSTWQGKLAIELEAQKYAEAALSTLCEIMGNPEAPAKSRIDAAAQILDRGYGKPVERSVIAALSDDGSGKGYSAMTTKQLLALALGNDRQVIDSTAESAESVPDEAGPPPASTLKRG